MILSADFVLGLCVFIQWLGNNRGWFLHDKLKSVMQVIYSKEVKVPVQISFGKL